MERMGVREECDIVRWSEGEFSKHAEYSLIPSLYTNLRYRIHWISFPNTSIPVVEEAYYEIAVYSNTNMHLCYTTVQYPCTFLPSRKEGLDFTSGEGGPRKTVAELPKVWISREIWIVHNTLM